MKNALLRICTTAAAALLIAGSASAHRAWMLPSSFTLSGEEQWVTVDGAISNKLFYPNHVPMNLESVAVMAPDGAPVAIENASTGKYRSVFDLKLDHQGTYKISYTGAGYSAAWKEGSEIKRWRGSMDDLKAEGLAGTPGVEITRNFRRNETFVTLGTPTDTVFAKEGTGLELKPVTHPNDVFASEDVTFQFLLDGKPAQGVSVQIVRGNDRYRYSEDALALTSDAGGMITFVPELAGAYWLEADLQSESTLEGKSIVQRAAYVVTFEALPN